MKTNDYELDGLGFNENIAEAHDIHQIGTSYITITLKIIAWMCLFFGIFSSFYWGFTDTSYRGNIYYFQLDGDFNAGIFFLCLIYSVLSFSMLLGFAKIVEAADKYLKQ